MHVCAKGCLQQTDPSHELFMKNIFCRVSILAAGLPDGLFSNKNPNLGKIWRALKCKMLLYFMIIWNMSWPFGIMYGSLVKFVVIWYIFPFWYVWTKKNLATMLGCCNGSLNH
jgi:hypothetical protein